MKNRLQWSKLYSFCCSTPSVKDDVLDRGFSRVVYCNQPTLNLYPANYVSTTKYNIASFIPKALFEQFRRVANIYFLFAAVLSVTPLTPFLPASLLVPLVFVLGVSVLKEGLEDWRRYKQDKEVNRRQVMVHTGTGEFEFRRWQQLQVGDVVMVEKDEFFPADLLLISSCFDDGVCYVETMNLDGETNLKVKQSLEITSDMMGEEHFETMRGLVKCEDPNNNLYTFVGTLDIEDQIRPIGPQQLLLRDSKLRNTDFIFGVVIFSGHDTKVMQNATSPPSKRSRIERKMDRIIYCLFSLLILISTIGSVAFGIRSKVLMPRWWYLFPADTTVFYNPKRPSMVAILHLITALILYGYLIPISLYVSIEVVKVAQATLISRDHQLFHEETNRPALARTSNLNEELGQVDTILSDKTGTLTCNVMNFLKCSIAGTPYGRGVTEVERSIAKRLGREEDNWEPEPVPEHEESYSTGSSDFELRMMGPIKGFSFKDERLMYGNWVNEPNSEVLKLFFRTLAVCQTAIAEEDYQTGMINYEAESPDEAAFVVAAREFGFTFFKRTQTSVLLIEPAENPKEEVQREYKVLNLLEFSSDRKRMSVIVRTEDDRLMLFSKGADSVMFERLGDNGRVFEEATRGHLSKYAEAGLRTLVLAYRILDEVEYRAWNEVFQAARTTVGVNRSSLLETACELIEKDLILIGATAVEDKLQHGVPECIERLAQAGIKIWVLTGDKLETAINIGFACSLLRQGMKQILITSEQFAFIEEATAKAYVGAQMKLGQDCIDTGNPEGFAFALIIDGRALDFALEDEMKMMFLKLASSCASVICCRVSPLQKALVTRLVRSTGRTTLSIGDGANDVGMIQEADIGVGISGVEGMQAVMASDFSIAQFRFLERLLIVHGHWCYKRISLMICYFFYKNVAFGLTLFYYEAHTGFSGQTVYNDWTMSLFNVLFTSLPVMVLGILEQDVSARACLQFPALYQQGPQNLLFSWTRILCWLLNSVYSSVIAFFFTRSIYKHSAFRKDGKTASLDAFGTSMYTCVMWMLCIQIALATSYFTWLQHLSIWGSLVLWYSFLLVYGSLSPSISTTGHQVLVEVLAPSSVYWLSTLLVPISCVLPYLTLQAFQRMFKPMDHHLVQEIRQKHKM